MRRRVFDTPIFSADDIKLEDHHQRWRGGLSIDHQTMAREHGSLETNVGVTRTADFIARFSWYGTQLNEPIASIFDRLWHQTVSRFGDASRSGQELAWGAVGATSNPAIISASSKRVVDDAIEKALGAGRMMKPSLGNLPMDWFAKLSKSLLRSIDKPKATLVGLLRT